MNGKLAVTRVINATIVLELPEATVLTDPFFDSRWFLPFSEPIGMTASELPALDVILGGHGVCDHWQPGSMRGYPWRAETPVFVATSRMAKLARRAGFEHVEVLAWGEERHVTDRVRVSCVPGERVTGMKTNAYLVSNAGVTVYIGTEARSLAPIRQVGDEHHIDAAVLPVNGAKLLGRRLVMDAATAVQATRLLGARVLVPIHYSQRPLPLLLRCPTGLHDVHHAAHENNLTVVAGPTGTRCLVL